MNHFCRIVIATVVLATPTWAFVVMPATSTSTSTSTSSTTTRTSSSLLMSVGGVIPLARMTGQSQLDPTVIQKYLDLPMPEDTVLAEYVWVDAAGNTRSKTRTLPAKKVSGIFPLMLYCSTCFGFWMVSHRRFCAPTTGTGTVRPLL